MFQWGGEDAEMRYLLEHGMTVGRNFACYSDYCFDSLFPWLIHIGDDVTISTDVRVLAHDASMKRSTGLVKLGRVVIGNNVFIGQRVSILCNTTIGDNVVVGTGSVCTGVIPSNTVVAGNPAKVLMSYDTFVAKHQKPSTKRIVFQKKALDLVSRETWQKMNDALQSGFGYIDERM